MTVHAIWLQSPDVPPGSTGYPARMDRQIIATERDEGVLSPADFAVTAPGGSMNLSVAPGYAWVVGDDQANQGTYLLFNDLAATITVGTAPGANSRYDIVVARVKDSNASAGYAGVDAASIEVIAGTVAASPTVPDVPPSAIRLATIGPILSSTTTITSGMVAGVPLIAGVKGTPGQIEAFAAPATLVPNGWLLCYGQAVSRATYPRLFAMIGTTFGAGDGSTTFNLPDLRGRMVAGVDNMGGTDAGRLSSSNTVGNASGQETVTLDSTQMPPHVHGVTDPWHAHTVIDPWHSHVVGPFFGGDGTTQTAFFLANPGSGASGAGFNGATAQAATGVTIAQAATGISIQSTGGGSAHTNMPPHMLLNWIIRT